MSNDKPDITTDEWRIVKAVLLSHLIQNEIGAEHWDLSESDEEQLWVLIERLRKETDARPRV